MTDLTHTPETPADITLYQTAGHQYWLVVGDQVIQMPATYDPDECFHWDAEAIAEGDWTVADAAAEHPVLGFYEWQEAGYWDAADVVATYNISVGRRIAHRTEEGLEINVYMGAGVGEFVVEYLSERVEDHTLICDEPEEMLEILPVSHYAVYATDGLGHATQLQHIVSMDEAESEEDAARQTLDMVGAIEGVEYTFAVYATCALFEQLHDAGINVTPVTRPSTAVVTG